MARENSTRCANVLLNFVLIITAYNISTTILLPQAWRKVMAAYRRVDGFKSPAGWLPIHRDQLRAQRSLG